jgi:hypothetical protein
MSEQDREAAGIATQAENAALEHSVDGITTRQDATDLGVPMLPGDPNEPQGPEDALGPGPTRGDYRQRIGDSNYHPHIVVPVADAEPGQPQVEVLAQRPFAEEIGDVPGKGGVSTQEAVTRLAGGTVPAFAAPAAQRQSSERQRQGAQSPQRAEKPNS